MIRTTLAMMIFAVPVAAQDLAPETSVTPPATKAEAHEEPEPEQVDVAKPDLAEVVEEAPLEPGMRDQLQFSDADYAACLADLDSLNVTYNEAEPIIALDDRDCGVLRPLTVTEIVPGIEVVPAATIRCDTARSLADWMTDFVVPASKRLGDRGPVTAIENGSGYICRRRNNLPDGKLSEHAFGNAFDLMAFRFEDGSRIAIEPREADGSIEEAFQDAVRASACLEFSTVLGPGSDETHADHLHFDIISRNGGYRLCDLNGALPDD